MRPLTGALMGRLEPPSGSASSIRRTSDVSLCCLPLDAEFLASVFPLLGPQGFCRSLASLASDPVAHTGAVGPVPANREALLLRLAAACRSSTQ
jgi:hypothetical protein